MKSSSMVRVHDLMVPSGSASGYKIKFNQTLNSGQEMDVTLEFDAEKLHSCNREWTLYAPACIAMHLSHRSNGDG
jgi:hypothetical protein